MNDINIQHLFQSAVSIYILFCILHFFCVIQKENQNVNRYTVPVSDIGVCSRQMLVLFRDVLQPMKNKRIEKVFSFIFHNVHCFYN